MKREQIDVLCLFRYVDNIRNFLRPFVFGFRWNGEHFVHSEEAEKKDIVSGRTDQERTMCELVKAMSSLVTFLEFEGEVSEMFAYQP